MHANLIGLDIFFTELASHRSRRSGETRTGSQPNRVGGKALLDQAAAIGRRIKVAINNGYPLGHDEHGAGFGPIREWFHLPYSYTPRDE